jgi:hypothetical protein
MATQVTPRSSLGPGKDLHPRPHRQFLQHQQPRLHQLLPLLLRLRRRRHLLPRRGRRPHRERNPRQGSVQRRHRDRRNFVRETRQLRTARHAFHCRDVCLQSRIVRPLESTTETQPQLQPDALRLSAVLLIIVDDLRGRFARFKLGAHLLDLRCLLFELRSKHLNSFLLLSDGRIQCSDARGLF